jgi:pilus assembly protein Flp/PilA
VKQLFSYLIGLNGRIMAVVRGENGQGLVEYGLILFFIALVAVAALTFLGSDISTLLSEVGNKL